MSEYDLTAVLQVFGKHGITAPTVKLDDQGDMLSAVIIGRRNA